jgi:hypothetical protein
MRPDLETGNEATSFCCKRTRKKMTKTYDTPWFWFNKSGRSRLWFLPFYSFLGLLKITKFDDRERKSCLPFSWLLVWVTCPVRHRWRFFPNELSSSRKINLEIQLIFLYLSCHLAQWLKLTKDCCFDEKLQEMKSHWRNYRKNKPHIIRVGGTSTQVASSSSRNSSLNPFGSILLD